MTISSTLSESERVDFLKENREEIINEIYFCTGVRKGDSNLLEIMTRLLECTKDYLFYDLCDMSTRSFDVVEHIGSIYDEISLECDTNVECQEYFDQQRQNQMNLIR